MGNLEWSICAQRRNDIAQLPHNFAYIAQPRIVVAILNEDPDDDEGGNIGGADTEKNYRDVLHRRGASFAESLARVRAMPRFYKLGFDQGIESRQTSYQPGTGYGPFLADTLMLSASGMMNLAVIFGQGFNGNPWKLLSRFLDGQDRANAMRFLDNVVARYQRSGTGGSMTRFTLPEIARFDSAALLMM